MTAPPFLTIPALGVPHGFFTRVGGVSTGGYASLNASLSGGDDPGLVRRNRARACAALGRSDTVLLGLRQVHGKSVVTVGDLWAEGEGPDADALVTRRADATLCIVTADCAPILLADAQAGVVGAAHAGWRGLVACVLEATVAAMVALGADRGRLIGAIGPCIGQPSYEVGGDLRDAVVAGHAASEQRFTPGRRPDKWQFDLAGACADRLRDLALVQTVAADTAAEPDRFFSHRRRTLAGGGAIGHQMALIGRLG